MRAIKTKMKELKQRRKISLRNLDNEISRAAEAIKRLQAISELHQPFKVTVYAAGLVMRIEDDKLKTRMLKKFSLENNSQFNEKRSEYIYSIGELYKAESMDTKQALYTAEQAVSDRAKAFYSHFLKHKYREVPTLNTTEGYVTCNSDIWDSKRKMTHKQKLKEHS